MHSLTLVVTNIFYSTSGNKNAYNSSFLKLQELLGRAGMDGNMIFSPLSLALVLLIIRFGARGRTASEIDGAMGLPVKEPDAAMALLESYQQLLKATEVKFPLLWEIIGFKKDKSCFIFPCLPQPNLNRYFKFRVDSKMFARDKMNISQLFKQALKCSLGNPVQPVDFSDMQKATEAMNEWVSRISEGKIGQLFSPGCICFFASSLTPQQLHAKILIIFHRFHKQ